MIFFHSHKFINKEGNYYTSGSLNNRVFQRYIRWFGEVTVLANERKATNKYEKFINDSNIVNCINFDLINTKNIFAIARKIKQAVTNHDYIVARMPSFISILAIEYAKKKNKKYLVEVVGCPWDAYWNHSLMGKIIAPFMWYLTKRLVKSAPYALYVTNEFLQRRYPCLGNTTGCSDVELEKFDMNILKRRLDKIANMSSQKPIVLGTVAAVNVRYKGQEYVIKAISRLIKQGYNYEYHLAGGGDISFLHKIAEKNGVAAKVKFLGSLPHDKVFEYLDNIDVYIQPSKQEGLPRALIEAMSRGCPALGSTSGGIPELLNKEFIFHNGSVNEICGILEKVDIEILKRAAINNFNKSKEYDKDLLDMRRTAFYEDYTKTFLS